MSQELNFTELTTSELSNIRGGGIGGLVSLIVASAEAEYNISYALGEKAYYDSH
ncbi:bacteriocin [Streptococcus tangpeifui]|uniref:bacteriocin n=1 Tax=Streptococcus tangpeifui TaxID=2709400 RepID=UPI0013EAF15B|nr:bacteriocin [Streptococcus sp. ZJ1593]